MKVIKLTRKIMIMKHLLGHECANSSKSLQIFNTPWHERDGKLELDQVRKQLHCKKSSLSRRKNDPARLGMWPTSCCLYREGMPDNQFCWYSSPEHQLTNPVLSWMMHLIQFWTDSRGLVGTWLDQMPCNTPIKIKLVEAIRMSFNDYFIKSRDITKTS